MSSQQTSIVIIGISDPGPEAKFNRTQLWEMVDDEIARFAAVGWHAEKVMIEDVETYDLAAYKDLLAARSWTVVAIGFGVRGQPKLTKLFETLVNTAVETITAPPPKFVFQGRPNDVFEGVERVLGPDFKA